MFLRRDSFFNKSLWILGLGLYSLRLLTAPIEFEFDSHHFQILPPPTWKVAKNLYGLPLSLLGPQPKKGKRPTIAVIPTSIKPVLTTSTFKEEFETYQKGRKKWLIKRKGKLLGFEKPLTFKTPYHYLTHRNEFRYLLGPESFVEVSYWINCPRQIVQIKGLFTKQQWTLYQNTSAQVVNSFKCLKKDQKSSKNL